MELAKGVDEGVDEVDRQGGQGWLRDGRAFHSQENTPAPPIFRTPSSPLDFFFELGRLYPSSFEGGVNEDVCVCEVFVPGLKTLRPQCLPSDMDPVNQCGCRE